MQIKDWLEGARKQLGKVGLATAGLDALVLLEDLLRKDRTQLLAHPELELNSEQQNILNQQLVRRIKHEPLAYIRGKTEFYGREFIVNKDVLEPRPETETMIDLLKKLPLKAPKIADIGTGSGAIAITAKLEIPNSTVTATDIDAKCLSVARKNVQKHKANVDLVRADLLGDLKVLDVLLCNLPYVPNDFGINKAALHEPHIAIFGGEDGLDLYRKLFKQIDTSDNKPSYIFTESLPFQHKDLAKLAQSHGYTQHVEDDFIQVFTNN